MQVIKTGRVYAVEPVEVYRRELNKLIKNNPVVTLMPFALGDENLPSITLGMPSAFADLGYLRHGVVTMQTDERTIAGDYQFKSELKKANEVFANIEQLDYIKCDIEGHEVVVLKELKSVLQKHKPLVQLETWGEQLPVMLEYFASIEFEAYHLSDGKLSNAKNLSLEKISSSDILFVHPSRQDRILPFLQQ